MAPGDPRSAWQKLRDRAAVSLHGGVRVRVVATEPERLVTVEGRTPGPTPEQIWRAVLDLDLPGPGTIDLVHTPERRRWWIRTRGALTSPRLEQRLRNVLGNG